MQPLPMFFFFLKKNFEIESSKFKSNVTAANVLREVRTQTPNVYKIKTKYTPTYIRAPTYMSIKIKK